MDLAFYRKFFFIVGHKTLNGFSISLCPASYSLYPVLAAPSNSVALDPSPDPHRVLSSLTRRLIRVLSCRPIFRPDTLSLHVPPYPVLPLCNLSSRPPCLHHPASESRCLVIRQTWGPPLGRPTWRRLRLRSDCAWWCRCWPRCSAC